MARVFYRAFFAFLLVALGTSVLAEAEAATSRKAPGIVVSFEGGLAGQNIAIVLEEIAKSDGGVPKETYTVQKGDALCSILTARGYPPDCARLAQFVDTLNTSTRPAQRGLKVGDALILPKLEFSSYRTTSNYLPSIDSQVKKAAHLQQVWQHLGVQQTAPSSDRITIDYQAYELYIPMPSDDAATALAERLAPYRSTNVLIDILRSTPRPARANSSVYTASDAKDFCQDNSIATRPFQYSLLVDGDPSAQSLMKGVSAPDTKSVKVTLIDVSLTASPNLYPSFGKDPPPGATWRCHWVNFVLGWHHATHLASIIASQQKGFGFFGLAPNATLDSFEYIKPVPEGDGNGILPSSSDRSIALSDRMLDDSRSGSPTIPVYLAATLFDSLADGQNETYRLNNPDLRLNANRLVGRIFRLRPLLVVAAGQPEDSTQQPVEIDARANVSPPNLGDLGNVLVVTACEDCTRKSPRLWPNAYFGRKGESFVHVAAPGGTDIPGWLTPKDIGAAHGTSQAAAFVAGMAAAMIGQYPEIYRTPDKVKTRIQVTSRPFPPSDDGRPRPDADKLAAGIVDPILSLLDPRQTWLNNGQGWQSVKVRSWPAGLLSFKNADGVELPLRGGHILRIVRTREGANSATRWSVYVDRTAAERADEAGLVGRLDQVTMPSDAVLTMCDGSHVPLDRIADFITAIQGIPADACASPVSVPPGLRGFH